MSKPLEKELENCLGEERKKVFCFVFFFKEVGIPGGQILEAAGARLNTVLWVLWAELSDQRGTKRALETASPSKSWDGERWGRILHHWPPILPSKPWA